MRKLILRWLFGTDDIESCVSMYPNKLIVTLGCQGIMYHNGNEIVKIPAIPVKHVEDTTGAGDTFNGNFAAAMNISEHTLSKKLNNKSSFDQHEIRKACELLNIAPNKIKDYFFEIKVQND